MVGVQHVCVLPTISYNIHIIYSLDKIELWI